MNFNEISKSKSFKWALFSVGVLIILLTVFSLGMFAGFHKARFSYKWEENYQRNFGGPGQRFMREPRGLDRFTGRNFMNPNGITGIVIKINSEASSASSGTSTSATTADESIVIKGNDNIERTILIDKATAMVQNREDIRLSDLKINDSIIVIGEPNDSGQIIARLIRVFK